jgi:hypothetical protein
MYDGCIFQQRFSNLPKDICQEYLLKSIYETDDLSIDQKSLKVKDHIYKATPMERVRYLRFAQESFQGICELMETISNIVFQNQN